MHINPPQHHPAADALPLLPPGHLALTVPVGGRFAWLRLADNHSCSAHQLNAVELADLARACLDAAAVLSAAGGDNVVPFSQARRP